jgi:vitamin B12 transporter
VSGRVSDPSGAVLAGAQVVLFQNSGAQAAMVRSDESGSYRLTNLLPGNYWLTARLAGFADSKAELIELRSAAVQRDLQLALNAVETQLTVTETGTLVPIDELSKSSDRISAAQLRERGEFSVTEALRQTPGVRVQQLGGPGSLTRVHMRGGRAFDTSILIDGFRFRDVSAPQGDATGFLGDLLVMNSERIEVLRGSGSSLYGTNAIGGVANLVTDQGGGPLHGELSLEGGGLGFFRGVTRVAGGLRENRFLYSAAVTHLNVVRGLDGDDRVRNSGLQGSAQYRLAPKTTLGGRVFATGSYAGLNVNPAATPSITVPSNGVVAATPEVSFLPQLNDPDSSRQSDFFAGLVTLTHQLMPGTSLRGHYHGFTTNRDNRNGPVGPSFQPVFANNNLFESRIDTGGARGDVSLGGRNLLSVGYEYERELFDNLATDDNPSVLARIRARTRVAQASHAVFAQQQTRLLKDRLQLSLSGRIQRFDLKRPGFEGGAPSYGGIALTPPPNAYTGDVALSYFVAGTGTKLRSHFGNAYRAPSLYERFGTSFFGGSFSPYGDPRLAPERSISVDAGFDQYLAGSKVRVSGTWFYTRLQQVIGFDFSGVINSATDPYGRFGGYRNTGGGLSRGLEFAVEANPRRGTRLSASYTYTNADERYSSLLGGSLRTIRVSDHMTTFTATHSLTRRLDVTFDLFAASDYLYPFFAGGSRAFSFNGPVKADVSATYTVPLADTRKLQFYTRVDNMLNRTYYEDGFQNPKAWAIGGMRVLF